MANRNSGHRAAGGLHSRQVVHRPHSKTEPIPHARNPAKVAQYGQLVGNHATNTRGATNYKGEPDFTRKGYSPPQGPTSFSNVGVGGGRTVHKTGSQDQYDSGGAPKPSGRDILGSFGPEKSGS